MKTKKTIWDLKLHEHIKYEDIGFNILRVAGGWLYSYGATGNDVFVPLSEDLKPTEEPAETVVDLGKVD